MNIVEIKHPTWDSEELWIHLEISNICNYKCWYCWPNYNSGTIKWPNYDLLIKNVSHLIDYYFQNTNKKKVTILFLGGEVTHWKRFQDIIRYFKEKYNAVIELITNASKNMKWWQEIYSDLDKVSISVHGEYADSSHIISVADFLYDKNVYVETNVFMDPQDWDGCEKIVADLTTSKFDWTIHRREIIHETGQRYNDEQKEMIRKPAVRKSAKPTKFVLAPMSDDHPSLVVDDEGKEHLFNYKELLLNKMNKFKGWECDVGVDWISIQANGTISGICGNKLYNDNVSYNIFDEDLIKKFNPIIQPTICELEWCWCIMETNLPKRKVNNIMLENKKIIYIKNAN